MAREGDYIILTGSRQGAVYHKGKWQGFACSICAREQGLLITRISTTQPTAHKKASQPVSKLDIQCQSNPRHR